MATFTERAINFLMDQSSSFPSRVKISEVLDPLCYSYVQKIVNVRYVQEVLQVVKNTDIFTPYSFRKSQHRINNHNYYKRLYLLNNFPPVGIYFAHISITLGCR